MFEILDSVPENAEIKVIGVGGGGGNAIQHMIDSHVDGVEFICANTDAQALKGITGATLLQLGNGITRGLGAGADPEVGYQAAMDDRERIADVIKGADMVFVTAGMGGGTGTGAAPVVADVAKEMGILTVAVVTRPFAFEGRKRMATAEMGIKNLKDKVDSLITIPNEKLVSVLGKATTLLDAFKAANNVLLGAVQGIADLIIRPGMINVDFADVRTVMSEMGMAMMGSGVANGEDRARIAAEAAIHSPLLEDINLKGARGILVSITAGPDIALGEFSEVGETIESFASVDANVIIGTVLDVDMADEIRVTVVATGLGGEVNAQAKEPERVQTTAAQVVTPQASAAASTRAGAGNQRLPQQNGQEYSGLDKPTIKRRNVVTPVEATASRRYGQPESDMDYLDVPSFLRNQVD